MPIGVSDRMHDAACGMPLHLADAYWRLQSSNPAWMQLANSYTRDSTQPTNMQSKDMQSKNTQSNIQTDVHAQGAARSAGDLRAPQVVRSGAIASVHLTLAVCDYEHVREIAQGLVQADGITLTPLIFPSTRNSHWLVSFGSRRRLIE